MIGGRHTGTVTIERSLGYVNGSLDCWLVIDHDTGKYWRVTESEQAALKTARALANGRPVVRR